jgi:hypothetical protein
MLPESPGPEKSDIDNGWHFAKFYENDKTDVRDDWRRAVGKHSYAGQKKYLAASLRIVDILEQNGMDDEWTAAFLGTTARGEEPFPLVIPGVGSHENKGVAGVYVMNLPDISTENAEEIRDMMDIDKSHALFDEQKLHYYGREHFVRCVNARLESESRGRLDLQYLGTTSNGATRKKQHNSFCPTKKDNQFNSIVVHAANSVMQAREISKRFSFEIIVTEKFMEDSILDEVKKLVPEMTLYDLGYLVEGVLGALLDTVNCPGGKVRDQGHQGVPPEDHRGGLPHMVRFSLNLSSLEHELCRCRCTLHPALRIARRPPP